MMKKLLILVLLAACFTATAQDAFPYNPDSNGDSAIGVPDLMSFLPLFGSAFMPDAYSPEVFTLDESLLLAIDTIGNPSSTYINLEVNVTISDSTDVVVFRSNDLMQALGAAYSEDNLQLKVKSHLPQGSSSFKGMLLATTGNTWPYNGVTLYHSIYSGEELVMEIFTNNFAAPRGTEFYRVDSSWFRGGF